MVRLEPLMENSNKNQFSFFKVHTQYSICEGAARIEDLKEFCYKNKIKSIGISDTNNLCGVLEFSENLSSVGTQPIIGTQILFEYKEFNYKQADSLREEINNFVLSCIGKEKPLVDGEQGMNAVKTATIISKLL